MKVITKTLSRKISFRGLGFVQVNGLHVGICGSRLIDCGNGSEVKWIDEQLIQVPPEPEIKATVFGAVDDAATNVGDLFFTSQDKKYRLYNGWLEGHLLGVDIGATGFIAMPPLKMTFMPVFPRVGMDLDGMYNAFDPVGAGDTVYGLGAYINLVE